MLAIKFSQRKSLGKRYVGIQGFSILEEVRGYLDSNYLNSKYSKPPPFLSVNRIH